MPGTLDVSSSAAAPVFGRVVRPDDRWDASSTVRVRIPAAIKARSWDPLVPVNLDTNRNIVADTKITILCARTMGSLPYAVTVLFRIVENLAALQAIWSPRNIHCLSDAWRRRRRRPTAVMELINLHVGGLDSHALRAAVADGTQFALWPAAASIICDFSQAAEPSLKKALTQ